LLPFTADVPADINRRPHEPGLDRPLQIEPVEVFVSPEKDFLSRILGVFGCSQKSHGESDNLPFIPQHQTFKGTWVTMESLLNERCRLGGLE
jgi:hypothetical protein